MIAIIRRPAALLLIVALIVILLPGGAMAQFTDPDTVSIEDVQAFRHMLEPDDLLMIARYDVSYANDTDQPALPIDRTFVFSYTTSGNDTVGNETAYPLFNLGYGQGLVGFYWDADDADIPAWEDLGNLTVTGNDTYYGAPVPADTYTLTSANYSPYTSPADIREDLRQWLTGQITFVELDWNNWNVDQGYENRQIDLLVEIPPDYLVLSSSGEGYMSKVVDNFRYMCPLLYFLQTSQPVHVDGNWTLSQQDLYEDLHTTDYVGNATTAVGAFMGGVDQIWAATLLTLFAALGLVVVCQHYWQKANIGMLTGYTITLLATPEGMIQMGIMALFTVMAVLMIVHTFFWSRSAG